MNVTYQLTGDRAILTKCDARCDDSKISVQFLNKSDNNLHLIVNDTKTTKVIPIKNGNCILDLDDYNGDTLTMRVSKTVSPLKSWTCDEIIFVKNREGRYYIFPNAAKMLETLSKLRIFKKDATHRLFTLEEKIKNIEGEVSQLLGGYVTE